MNIFGIDGLYALILAVPVAAVVGWWIWKNFYESTPLSSVHGANRHEHHEHEGTGVHICKYDQAEQRRTAHIVNPIDYSNLPPADPKVAALIATVSVSEIETQLRDITGEQTFTLAGETKQIVSRNSHAGQLELAHQYLEAYYAGLGLKTFRHEYKIRGTKFHNLVVEFPGKVNPRKCFVGGAHLDSTAGNPWRTEKVAPGADDDASGTVGIMQLAKLLTKVDNDFTIRLVHFTCEEQGLYGSYAYSDAIEKENFEKIGMIEMDMIGYCKREDHRVDIHDDVNKHGAHKLVEILARAAKQYGLNLSPVDTHNRAVENRSDHAGFQNHKWMAVLVSDPFTDEDFNPNYHTTSDRVSTLNLPYMAEVIKMVAVATFQLAGCKVR
ncbi:MAG: M28 family peptidase [Candidatus Obscuribacterales bacterium]|jgi:hypothetical protein|nr:M28 family peptidase [Candidatus Obscuribacterales bacterium]